ncbi:MAG: hypothetical protein V1793_00955 [Pseudomonadota bacterium]
MYQKFTYWLSRDRYRQVKDILSGQGHPIQEVKRAVCVPLSGTITLGSVSPDAWTGFDTCRRQLSWYYASEHNGQYLLISGLELWELGLDDPVNTLIRMSGFKPGPLSGPDFEQKRLRLSAKASYCAACPPEFRDLDGMDPALQDRWLKIMGIRGLSYGKLFEYHSANHANFFEPEFFEDGSQGPVPYSIGKTSRVCSACLELFNIIGKAFATKYVVPCPGAVLFAGMAVNRYYEVTSGSGR